jgi:hypothetical protein
MVIDGPDAPIPPSSIPATVPGPSSQSDQQAQSSNSQQTEEVVAHNPAKVQSQTDESVVQTQQNESEESSQEVAQSFQEFWGKLHPCSGAVKHVDLRLDKWEYTVGRHSGNDIVLNGAKISKSLTFLCVRLFNPCRQPPLRYLIQRTGRLRARQELQRHLGMSSPTRLSPQPTNAS